MTRAIPSITNIDDEKIVAQMSAARNRVLLISPGISKPVAQAIHEAWRRLGSEGVTIILDVDSEVCRLGYGSLEGLNTLKQAAGEAQTLVCHHPGVRIGVLICDELTSIFSPTPLLIEAGSNQPHRPNAIQLASPPSEIARDVGLGDKGQRDRIVGLDPVQPEQIAEVEQQLAKAPPVKFDARRVRVFNSRFQFVELEMTGCFVSRKKVPIPSNLVGLANNPAVGSQFHAQFNLVNRVRLEVEDDDKRVITEKSLGKDKQQIIKDFLITLKGYGSVVLRANKDGLIKAVEALKTKLTVFQKGIEEQLQEHMNENAAALVEALLPTVKTNPPLAYTKFHGPKLTPEQTRQFLEQDIQDAFGDARDLVEEMKVTLVFKDIAYESLVDPKFIAIAREAMPELEFLHEEHEVVEAELFPRKS